MQSKLLVVDDEWTFTASLSRYLSRKGFSVREVSSLEGAKAAVAADFFHAVLLDLALPDGNGLDWIEELRSAFPGLAIIVITGSSDVPVAVEAMRRGADHFIVKPADLAELEMFLRKSLEVGAMRRRSEATRRLSKQVQPFSGTTPAARHARDLATVASETDAVVLISGETGTGKGVMANWIHQQSRRRSMPFVEVNCSILRGELLASELFGHARGAFTSANEHRSGLLDAADGGTLFLDEIGDMDPAIQVQFLKVIEDKRYRRLGETNTRQSDFRLICATNHSLEDDVASGRFRRDLFFRIQVLPIQLPPLRETREDFRALLGHVLAGMGGRIDAMAPDVIDMLEAYDWPGNVRELKNVLERALLLARGGPIGREHLRAIEQSSAMTPGRPAAVAHDTARILDELRRCGGDKERAAQRLGISRATLYRRLQALERQSGRGVVSRESQ